MATAINFNWVINEKVTDGKIYDFTFFEHETNAATACTFCKRANMVTIAAANGCGSVQVEIFRNGMSARDAIAVGLKKSGRVTSGEVYKAEILREVRDEYETNEIYTGIFQPSHEFRTNKPHKNSSYFIGFELETAGRNTACEIALHNLKSNIWRQVSDASIRGNRGTNGIEFVSTLIHPDDAVKAAFYEDFCGMLTGLAVSSSLSSTGLHCHISREAFGEDEETQNENIAKCIYMENFVLSSRSLTAIFGRDASSEWARPNNSDVVEHVEALKRYCRNIINEKGVRDALKADLLQGNKIRNGHNYPSERYHRVNITNKYTVEFRQGKGQIKSAALANIAQHVTTIAAYCKATKWANLSAVGYWRSIPTSAKYSDIKRAFSPSETE